MSASGDVEWDDVERTVSVTGVASMSEPRYAVLVELTRCPDGADVDDRRAFAAVWLDRSLKREGRLRPTRRAVIRSRCCSAALHKKLGEVFNVPGVGPVILQPWQGAGKVRICGPLRGEIALRRYSKTANGSFQIHVGNRWQTYLRELSGDYEPFDAIPGAMVVLGDHEGDTIDVRCPSCGEDFDLPISDVRDALAEHKRTGKPSRLVTVG